MNRRGFLSRAAMTVGGLLAGASVGVTAAAPPESDALGVATVGEWDQAAYEAYVEGLQDAVARWVERFDLSQIPTAQETADNIRTMFGALGDCCDWWDANMGVPSEDEDDWYDDDWECDA